MITQEDINSMRMPRLLIIGYARHGKDTVAEMLAEDFGFKFISSSEFVGREVLWKGWGESRYATFDDMFDDRVNWRKHWMDMIALYNTPDKTKTARTMLERGYDLYVGMRRLDELEASRHLFDHVVWVDRSEHLPPETGSMDITQLNAKADYVIDNNGDLEQLRKNVLIFARDIGL
jgi:dephospho-CoA kinase